MKQAREDPFQYWESNLISIPYSLPEDIIPNSTHCFLLIEADDEKKFTKDILEWLKIMKANDPSQFETEIFRLQLSRIAKRFDYCNYESSADITVKLANLIYRDIILRKAMEFKHIALTIGELILNAIVYGNQLDLALPVFFSWEILRCELIISVGDYGIKELSFNDHDVTSHPEDSFARDFWEKIQFVDDEKISGTGLGIPSILKICGFRLVSDVIKDKSQKPLGKIIKAIKSL